MTADITTKADRIVKAGKSEMVVATLIATVSFTSALALPGGFNQNPGTNFGMAVLKSKASFRAFLVSDIIAFSCSTSAILLCTLIADALSTRRNMQRLFWARLLTVISLGAMGIALMTGVCAVLSHSSALVITIWVISVVFFVCYIPFLISVVGIVVRRYMKCVLRSREMLHGLQDANSGNFQDIAGIIMVCSSLITRHL
ncbi:protein ACCELERATED CELL DEATH 6-like [Chenopodium quinoa]|uniref:protein ACCELERATED CELL DEATH 6-like n=1 Tax=Chenopodium quinoa TaxID=63459 RepID=UPI000B773C45|nr:protein ACCELERATED CELL DEATH 6-like [Chenopodium quinoa]